MATKAEKVAVYTAKKKAAQERLKMLLAKMKATEELVRACDEKIVKAQDDEPIVIPEKPEKK